MESIITINIGTTSTRVVAFDMMGKELGYKRGAYPTFHPTINRSEQDPEQVYITVLFILKNIINNCLYPKKYKVKAIVFCSSMHSLMMVDEKGYPLSNAIIWSDNRAADIAEKLKHSKEGSAIYKETGTPIHAMAPLAKIAWFQKHDKERFAKTSKFISLKEYIIHQLSGEYLIDYSLASATGFLNLHNRTWEQKSLDFAGVDASKFSTPVSVFQDGFKLKQTIQKSLNLNDDVKLIMGSTDGCLSTLSSGAHYENSATISINSGGAVRVLGKSLLTNSKGSLFNYILDDDLFVSGGPTSNGGLAFDWACSMFFKEQLPLSEEFVSEVLRDAAKIKTGANGLVFLPYLQGERAPIWDSNARAVFFGLNITHEPIHMLRSVVEGIIYEFYSIALSLLKHRDFDTLYVNGKYAASPLWTHITSDVFNMPVNVANYKHGPNLGAAMIALKVLGEYKSLDDARLIVPTPNEVNPSSQKNKVYQKFYSLFERMTIKLEDEFRMITKIQ